MRGKIVVKRHRFPEALSGYQDIDIKLRLKSYQTVFPEVEIELGHGSDGRGIPAAGQRRLG
jgi:hypothetical protein